MSLRHVTILVFIPLLFEITSSTSLTGDLQQCIKSQRIIGGICASIADRPFQVHSILIFVQALLFVQNQARCGGSIISHRWILTAAHCVQRVPEQYLSISVGSSKVRGRTSQYYAIDEKIVHENFYINGSTVGNDIALLKTSIPIEYKTGVKPIILNRVPLKAGDETMVSGYGVTTVKKYSGISEYLMSVDGKVIGKNQCKSILRKLEPHITISNGTFCAGSLNGGKDSCQGDSGGPITTGNVLIGIVSWGLKCAEKMLPAFYTDVAFYFDWIVKNIHQNVCRKKRKGARKSQHGRRGLSQNGHFFE